MAVNYRFGQGNEFILDGYDRAKTFAGFLPGIAGLDGIPMWSFYVNRGQALGSFGVRDKNGTIMEFFPANTLCRNIERQGFRTFLRKDGVIHEAFSSTSPDVVERSMAVEQNVLSVVETNRTLGVRVTVTYFTVPGEGFAAIARKVVLENLIGAPMDLELLDGMPQLLPYGIGNGDFQAMANLMRAWFEANNLKHNIAFYKVRASTGDTEEVKEINAGNFYLAVSGESGALLRPIIDMDVIFGANTALSAPDGWDCPVEELPRRKQVAENKVSGGFAAVPVQLADSFTLYSMVGHAPGVDYINGKAKSFTPQWFGEKERQARSLLAPYLKNTETHTAMPLFDAYVQQCNLDNVLRGGYPLVFQNGERPVVYHVFSRKHGDTEREYNFFSLEPGYYSQGNGNFRDVNQNRRSDVLLNPTVGDFNVKHFMNLIQADGYNPLQVKGCTFTLDGNAAQEMAALAGSHHEELTALLTGRFTPGQLMGLLAANRIEPAVGRDEFLARVLGSASQNIEAEFGEGYWSDHWTYNMDLVESYLAVYPDQEEQFLFADGTYRFFQSPATVLPRAQKHVLAGSKVRQYGAVLGAHGKGETAWLKTKHGAGAVYQTNLFAKLMSLALMKFVNLDPDGMGIEMEAGRPGWNDALNGLPGLFGSGLGETAELLRVVEYLISACNRYNRKVPLFAEAAELLQKVEPLINGSLMGDVGDFAYWDQVNTLKEEYRQKVSGGIDGKEKHLSTGALLPVLECMRAKLEAGLEKARQMGGGAYPTFFSYRATEYEIADSVTNPVNGHQCVRVKAFHCKPLPLFLEGPARILKRMQTGEQANALCDAVKASDLYDRKLGMYKTSVSLDKTGHEIGRLRAFTPGWLERESVFLHMEYKYLYAMLKAGLHDRFYEDAKTALIPFLDPAVYGRSTLENSSFIASSANPDEATHGRGFVARLSGSTAEMLSIWFMMMTGGSPFAMEDGVLVLRLSSILPSWLFDDAGLVRFTFLGRTEVTYVNAQKRDTYGEAGVKPVKYTLAYASGEIAEIDGDTIGAPHALAVRDGEVTRIEVTLG